jgi:hypothetical protein
VRQIKELLECGTCQSSESSSIITTVQRRIPTRIEKAYTQKIIDDSIENSNRQPDHSVVHFALHSLLLIGERKTSVQPDGYEKIKKQFLDKGNKMENLIKKQDPGTQRSILAALASENCGIAMATLLGFEDCQSPNSEGQNASTGLQLSKEFFDNLCSEANSENLHVNLEANKAIQDCADTALTTTYGDAKDNAVRIEYFEALGEKFFNDQDYFDAKLNEAVTKIEHAQIVMDLCRNKGLELKINGENVVMNNVDTYKKAAETLLLELKKSDLTAEEKLKALKSLFRYPFMQGEYARAITPLNQLLLGKNHLKGNIVTLIASEMNSRKIFQIAISADGTEMRALAIVNKSDIAALRKERPDCFFGESGEDAYGMAFTHIKCDPEGKSELVCAMMAVHI